MAITSPTINFPYLLNRITNITPFTERDGVTFQKLLYEVIEYIEQLVPTMNTELEQLLLDFQAGITNAENTITTTKGEWQALFDAFMANVLAELEALNDQAVANLIGNTLSLTRIALFTAIDPQAVNPLTGDIYARRYGVSTANTRAQNTAALVAAIAAAPIGGTIQLPHGHLYFDPFTLGKNVKLKGAGSLGFENQHLYKDIRWVEAPPVTGTVLRFANTTGPAINIPGSKLTNGVALEDLAIIGSGFDGATGIYAGLDVDPRPSVAGWPLRLRFNNVGIANFGIGFDTNCENSTFHGLYILSCGVGLSTFWPFNGNSFHGLNVETCTVHALKIVDSDTNIFTGGVIQGNSAEKVVYLDGNAFNNLFEGIYLENGHNSLAESTWDLWVESGVKNEFRRVRFGSSLDVNPGIHLGVNARLTKLVCTNGAYKITMAGSRNEFYGYGLGAKTVTGEGNIIQTRGSENHTVYATKKLDASGLVNLVEGTRMFIATAGIVITLPSIAGADLGSVISIKATTGACTIQSTSLIDGQASVIVLAYKSINLMSDGTQWLSI